MTSKFLHVGFNFEPRPIKVEELLTAFNLAAGWVRYAPNCWIICTHETPEQWARRLRPYLSEYDSVLVLEVPMDGETSYGWLPKNIWDWINQTKAAISAKVQT